MGHARRSEDDDPPPSGWRLIGSPSHAAESRSTARVERVRERFPLVGLTPGQVRRHKRNIVILAAIAGGAPLVWVAEAFGMAQSRIKAMAAEYRDRFGG